MTHPSLSRTDAKMAIERGPFIRLIGINDARNLETKNASKFILYTVEIQSVNIFRPRGAGFAKIKSHCKLIDGETHHDRSRLQGICFLRGNAVSIFVALYCNDGTVHSLLVDQPRIPIGQVSCLELPAGMIDDEKETVAGIAVKEMEEECGIVVRPSDLVDLTEHRLACEEAGGCTVGPHSDGGDSEASGDRAVEL